MLFRLYAYSRSNCWYRQANICGKKSDRCYNMSVEVTSLSKVKLAGRITVRDNGITQCHSSLRLFNISMHGEYKIITY